VDQFTASGFVIIGAVGLAYGPKWGSISALAVGVLALVTHFFH
jgi:hypothetical protein